MLNRAPAVPVNRDRLYEQVAQQIQAAIVAAEWPTGGRMPTERELGERFGVSRTVIREALKALSERGLVTIRPGRGVFVSDLTTDALKEPMRLLLQRHNISDENLVEARRVMEVEIAGLAAKRAEPWQIEKMRAAVAGMDEHLQDSARFIKADQEFHVALAESTQNMVFLFLIDSIGELLQEIRGVIYDVEGSPQRGQRYHRALLEAIVHRDPDAARRIMQDHLGQFESDVRAAARRAAADGRL